MTLALSCPCPRSIGYFLRGQLLRKGLWTEGISSCQSMVPHWLAWPMGMSWRFCTRHSCTKMSSWSSRKEMTSPGPPPGRSHTQLMGRACCPETPSPWSLEWEWVRHPLTSQQGVSSWQYRLGLNTKENNGDYLISWVREIKYSKV